MRQHHLLIAYSWGTADLGGIAIAPGLLKLIRKVAPDLPAVVMTLPTEEIPRFEWLRDYFPRFLPGCGAVVNPFKGRLGSPSEAGPPGTAWHDFHARWGETRLVGFETGSVSARVAVEIAEDLLGRFAEDLCEQVEREAPAAGKALTEAGFVLYNSGTVLNFGRMGGRSFWRSTLSFAMPLIAARALGIPYGINNHSFEAVDWPVELVYRTLFKDAAFVYCRDTDSLAYLKQKNLLNASSGFRPDSTFFFAELDEPWVEAFMSDHGLEDKGYMVLVPRTEIPGERWETREQAHAEKTVSFIEGWISKTGHHAVIIPESIPQVEPNKALHAMVSPAAREKCVCIQEFGTPEQASSLYRRARFVAGHMHSMMLALAVETPVLHIQFAEAGRKAWMIDDIGLGDWLLDIDEASSEELVDAALKIHENHDASVERVRAVLPMVEKLATGVIGEVERRLKTKEENAK